MAIVKEPEFTEAIETTDSDQQLQIPSELPVLPLRDIVIYPFMIVPLFVSREKSIRAVDEALGENRMILLASQKDLDKEEPTAEDLYSVGTAAVIMRMLKLPDGRIRILVQGLARARIESVDATGEYLRSRVSVMQEVLPPERSLEVEALVRNVRASMEKAINLGKNISPEVMAIIANLDDAGRLADLSASNLELKVEDAQSVLDIADTTARLRRVNDLLEQRDRSSHGPTGDQYSGTRRHRSLAKRVLSAATAESDSERTWRRKRTRGRDRHSSAKRSKRRRCRKRPKTKRCGN